MGNLGNIEVLVLCENLPLNMIIEFQNSIVLKRTQTDVIVNSHDDTFVLSLRGILDTNWKKSFSPFSQVCPLQFVERSINFVSDLIKIPLEAGNGW